MKKVLVDIYSVLVYNGKNNNKKGKQLATGKKTPKHYVNNKDFLEAIIAYKNSCDAARARGKQIPVIPDYIGQCIWHIANRLSSRPNFSGYAFREDMVMDGIENCLKYIEKFNPEKSSNPFAYFTQVIWFAFLQRIAKEKKFLYTKLKSSQHMLMMGETHAGGSEIKLNMNIDADYIDTFIQDYEDKMNRDKDKGREAKEAKDNELLKSLENADEKDFDKEIDKNDTGNN